MSEASVYPQCACSALFRTSDELDAHLDEQKSLKAALERSKANISAALGRCCVHSAVKSQNNQNGNEKSETGKGRHCPFSGCERVAAFSKRKELRIHFRMPDVECNEVCQCCAYRFRLASKFLRHNPDISQMDDQQAAYTTQRRDVIVKRVDEELHVAENKKRTREGEGEFVKTYKRAKLTEVDHSVTGFQHDAFTVAPSTPPNTSLPAAQGFDEPLQVGETLTEAGGEFAAYEPMPNLAAYNAPVHSQINWLAWTPNGGLDYCET